MMILKFNDAYFMQNQKIELDSNELVPLDTGDDILEIKVSDKEKKSGKTFDILVSRDLLIRIEKKRGRAGRTLVNDKFIKSIVAIKNLVSPKQRNIFKLILEHNRTIKEGLNADTTVRRQSEEKFADFYVGLERRWEEINKLEKKLKLSLLRKNPIGYCSNCFAFRGSHSLLPNTEVPPQTCSICKTVIKSNKEIKSLPDSISSYIDGTWFEDYVAEYLRKLDWTVWPQIFLYGGSGVKFEIDIFATKKGYKMIVECKTGGAGLKDLSTFLAKFYDIKTNIALFVSLNPVGEQLKNMVEKNPSIRLIDDVRNDRNLNARLKTLVK